MPWSSVRLLPGINVERTPTLLEAGYTTSNFGRFRDGLFEKIGGWVKFYPFNIAGVMRALFAWQDLNDIDHLAVGSTTQLGVITNGTYADLTPQTLVSDFTPDFSTTLGSNIVTIVDTNISDVTTFDSVNFETPISVGGIILSGVYPIYLVTGTHSYQIVAATQATAAVSNDGDVPQFDTTADSSKVDVTFPDHGLQVGNKVVFPLPTTVGGLTIQGTYSVTVVSNANTFSITAANAAASTATGDMNGGDCELLYYINLGPPASGAGYGLGSYGDGGYGTGTTNPAQVGDPITAVDWTFDNWGEIILACPKGDGIYTWQPTGGFTNAALISTGPPFNTGMFVAAPAQILVAYGSTQKQTIGIEQDPLLVKWSDIEDFTNWTVSTETQAGSARLPSGSRIVGGLSAFQNNYLWTDLDLWSMQYVNYPQTFAFQRVGSSCGLVAQHAVAVLGSAMFWMGTSNFYALVGSGRPQILPCPVWDAVFQNINTAYVDRCFAVASTPFNEVWFFYPSASSTGECDSYVKYNTVENAWDIGSLARACGIDQSVLGPPIMATSGGTIYSHEVGENADGQPIAPVMETGYFEIMEGEEFAFVDWLIPDFKYGKYGSSSNAAISITLKVVDFPGDTPRTYGPYSVDSSTQYVSPRLRGRQMSIRVESSDLNSFWRLGRVRYRFAQDGRR